MKALLESFVLHFRVLKDFFLFKEYVASFSAGGYPSKRFSLSFTINSKFLSQTFSLRPVTGVISDLSTASR